jgi:polyisoprenoid-binding protein YceI
MMRAAILVAILSAGAAAAVTRAAGPVTTYTADASSGHLDFVGVQAGAEFKGTFHKFTAAVDFAPDALANAHFDVQIDLNSLDTMDKDRDQTMRGSDMFDIAHFPAGPATAPSER